MQMDHLPRSLFLLLLAAIFGGAHGNPLTISDAGLDALVNDYTLRDGKMYQTDCNGFTRIKFKSVLHSNLGGAGPDVGKEGIFIAATEIDEENGEEKRSPIEVKINALSPYTPYKKEDNGMKGAFAIITQNSNDSVKIEISFWNKETDTKLKIARKIALSVYDLDTGGPTSGVEYFSGRHFVQANLTANTNVKRVAEDNDFTRFEATAFGTGGDNPTDPSDLSDLQKDKAVVLVYPHHTEQIHLKFGSFGEGGGPRYSMFVFESALLCHEVEITSTTTVLRATEAPTLAPTEAPTLAPTEAPQAIPPVHRDLGWLWTSLALLVLACLLLLLLFFCLNMKHKYRIVRTITVEDELPPVRTHAYNNGSTYTGEIVNSKREGEGTQKWQDGSEYSGQFQDNMMAGHGTFKHANGNLYEGQWKNDKAHGTGKLTTKNGSIYVGDWVDDKQTGQGKETWPDNSCYEGAYKDGKKTGGGKFSWPNGSSYEGDFLDNNFHGKGVYKWPDGRKYEGEWVDNKMDGAGIYTWNDGRKYEGQYQKDVKSGRGVFTWPDGRKYDGQWSEGKQNGQGTFTDKKGKAQSGNWVNGQLDRAEGAHDNAVTN